MELDEFRTWLRRRGRSITTIDCYCRNLERLLEESDPVEPILDRGYSPFYRRSLLTALRQWALFTEDDALLLQLSPGKIKLPHPQRKTPRLPLDEDEWHELLKHIDSEASTYLVPGIWAVCGIICTRGIRCGDVLRLQHNEIRRALKSGILSFVAKGERRLEFRAQPLRPYLKVLLGEKWKRKGGHVYNVIAPISGKNAPQTAGRKIRRAFDRIAKNFGCDTDEIYPHRLRHSYVNRFLEQVEGDPRAIYLLQDQMGWASANTAASYVKRASRKELDSIEDRMFEKREKIG